MAGNAGDKFALLHDEPSAPVGKSQPGSLHLERNAGVWPAARRMRRKPCSRRLSGGSDATRSEMKSRTTSSASRSPRFVTSTENRIDSSGEILRAEARKQAYSNVV